MGASECRPRRLRARVLSAAAVGLLAAPGALVVATASSVAGASTGSTGSTAQSLYQAALKAAGSEGVHFTSSASQGDVTIQVSGDAGTTSGTQTLTVTNGKSVEHVHAVVVGSTGYINGNATALEKVLGLTSAQAHTYAGRWLSFPTSDTGLATLVQGLLISQVPEELQMAGPLKFDAATTIDGQRVRGVRGYVSSGSDKVTVVLYVPASGTPLPIEEVTNPGASAKSSSIRGSVSFSDWGENTSIKAPSKSTSLLKLAPASSSGSSTSG